MDFIATVIVAVALMFTPATSPMEADAWASLHAHGPASVAECTPENSRYVDSGEHGTTPVGQYSVWSLTDENVFHHFACK